MIMPRVVVLSKGKPEMTYTSLWFEEFGYQEPIFVLSPGDDLENYQQTTGCQAIISDSYNLPSKRQWVLDNFTSKSCPWVICFEDNIKRVTRVSQSHYHLPQIEQTTRGLYHADEIGPEDVIDNMLEDIKRAEAAEAYIGGYSSNDNHFFRKKKYRTVAFVWTKMFYMRRGGPQWPTYLDEKDDYGMTAECLCYSGRTLVNNYLYPWAKRFEGRGGSPTLEERAPGKKRCVQILMERFPKLFRIKNRAGYPEGTEIQLRFTSEKSIDKWRAEL